MFHSQAAIGLALLPVAWASRDSASSDQGATSHARADFDRHFPAGWSRETVPDFPAAAASVLARVKSRWQATLTAVRRRARVAGRRPHR